MLTETIMLVLQAVEAILPLVTGPQSADTVNAIDKIITMIEGLLPQIATWSATMYTVATNILSSLQNSGNLTADQIAKTTSLLAQVDASWNSNLAQFDPDNPANAGTPAGDPEISPTVSTT